MNPLEVVGFIACCVALFVGVVTFLTVQGVPLPMAFLGVYLAAVGCMLGMQRRARESCESMERQRRRHDSRSERGARGGKNEAGTGGLSEPMRQPSRA